TDIDQTRQDAEHVAWTPQLLVECVQIIIYESQSKTIPVVRVPSKTSFDYMQWAMDAGAGGIIVPHMETAEEVKQVIAACRFPPLGHRSYPPFTFVPGLNDRTPEGDTIFTVANKHIAIIPQIESAKGVENLAEIVAFDEVSAFMIGAGDLRLDLGLPQGLSGKEPSWLHSIEVCSKVAKERNIPIVGIAIGAELLKQRIDEGFKMLITWMDMYALAFGIMNDLASGRATAEEHLKNKAAKGE
ncbi:Pyruvate/Phosphoenolpyruvate kinase-like domain-containing protein, partial [Mycena pura]